MGSLTEPTLCLNAQRIIDSFTPIPGIDAAALVDDSLRNIVSAQLGFFCYVRFFRIKREVLRSIFELALGIRSGLDLHRGYWPA